MDKIKFKRINGFRVYVKDGREVSSDTPDAIAKINGPHTDAKWAKDLLGCNLTASQRKTRIVALREQQRQDRARALFDLALQPQHQHQHQQKKKKWKPAKQPAK